MDKNHSDRPAQSADSRAGDLAVRPERAKPILVACEHNAWHCAVIAHAEPIDYTDVTLSFHNQCSFTDGVKIERCIWLKPPRLCLPFTGCPVSQ